MKFVPYIIIKDIYREIILTSCFSHHTNTVFCVRIEYNIGKIDKKKGRERCLPDTRL